MAQPRILLTGITGRLGPLILDNLLERVPASDIACLIRPQSGNARVATERLGALGVEIRLGDYDDSASLASALAGVERLMLVSGSALGVRVRQHRNVIDAAKTEGVGFIAYTSVLHADRSTLSVADDHRQTEAMLANSGLPHAILRNGWYSENLTPFIPAALAQHQLLGAASEGRIAAAERGDYAAAAAAMILAEHQDGRIYECAGDDGFTMAEFAAEAARQGGGEIEYHNLTEAEYDAALRAAGLPAELATILSTSHTAIAGGELFDQSLDLSRLTGRPTTPIAATIARMLHPSQEPSSSLG